MTVRLEAYQHKPISGLKTLNTLLSVRRSRVRGETPGGELLPGTAVVNPSGMWTAVWPRVRWLAWITVPRWSVCSLPKSVVCPLSPRASPLSGHHSLEAQRQLLSMFCLHCLLPTCPVSAPTSGSLLSMLLPSALSMVLLWWGWDLDASTLRKHPGGSSPPHLLEDLELLPIFHRSHCCDGNAEDMLSEAPCGRVVRVFLPSEMFWF